MSSNDSPKTSTGPSLFPLNINSRRGSLASLSGTAPVDKEQLSQALDRIHSTACQSDTLTTFNEFAPPPQSSTTEQQGIAGDIIQHGLSGLYSRFRGAVGGGKEKHGLLSNKGDGESIETASVKSIASPTPTPKGLMTISREDSGVTISPIHPSTSSSSRLQSPISSSFPSQHFASQPQTMKSSKTSSSSTAATTKVAASTRPTITPMAKPTASSAVVPTVAPVSVNAFKEGDKATLVNIDVKSGDNLAKGGEPTPSVTNLKFQASSLQSSGPRSNSERPGVSDKIEVLTGSTTTAQSRRSLSSTVDGGIDSGKPVNANQSASSSLSLLQVSSRGPKRPAAMDRITQSKSPSFRGSRASSTDRSTAEASPITTSAHNSVRHETFSPDESRSSGRSRIPGTTINEGAPEAVNARLEQMRKQVLSKEFWMADEICKECFLCNDSFSAFRRKHHCRTCGCIFDSKCTSTISGQRFGVQGTLRICKTCLAIINNRYDGSEESDDGSSLPGFFNPRKPKHDSSQVDISEDTSLQNHEQPPDDGKPRPIATPMMAIAARRVGDSANRHSLVLDDGPQLTRPGSSRSLKTLSTGGRPASAGHKRHQSRNNFLGRFKPTAEETAPFHHGRMDDPGKRARLPAFHDDNIIDPDLAPYMSDEESSADEQPSIFATMNGGNIMNPSFENDRSGFGSLLSASKKHRMRAGEKSVSGVSYTSRGIEETSGSASMTGFTRPNRRRNLSTANTSLLLSRTSPRQIPIGFGNLDEELANFDIPLPTTLLSSRMTRSASMRDAKAPVIELNNASLEHVHRLLRQLLEDAKIPNVASWEKALMPILLQCTDDVNPDVRHGDDIDIRHFVKTKKIPGGKPGDTSYVSGVVFSKNLALKSMLRSITNPRIVIVSFPIEYQRHQHHFMSLEPVIAQEKEFLKNMVNRIASLRPQLLLVQKNISGLALQYLVEANIAVAYNVKQSVIAAVSRFAQTEIISSIDMVALKPVHIGKCAGFDVKTYVHKDIPARKKTYIYLSGCPKELGCTIVLRGANTATLSRVKQITDFMVYVVYNLKLETCLMRDEWVVLPSTTENKGSISPSKQQLQSTQLGITAPIISPDTITAASDKLQAIVDQAYTTQDLRNDSNQSAPTVILTHEQAEDPDNKGASVADPDKIPNGISAHRSHTQGSHDDQLPDDIPMPTFYSDMVSKHQTKVLSGSPFVKFNQPYLLMRAREQERRLLYLKKLRDRDIFEEDGKSKPQKFQLIKPEMVHGTVKNASRQVMEVLHAVHDAEYDKAMHNYQTQKRQWENQVQINNHLFDPYAHQNITVLYTVVCTETKIPCSGPDLLALDYYNEREESNNFQPDCTLGQYVEDLCLSANTICMSNGCERKMSEHHRTYVHGEARITIIVERSASKIPGYQDEILMWSYCKVCEKETQPMPMSDSSWKYSLGKYLELSFWSSGLGLNATFCPHDLHRDHLRYFGYKNIAISIHYDPIDLLEIVVPRARITWKVDNDLNLKNDLFTKIEERWNRFMTSVKSRIKDINIDSVVPEKAESCKVEVERLTTLAQEEHSSLTRKLQQKYMESKYYEIIPMNRAVRAMQEKVARWDDAFANFETNFFPSERDIRRLATLQLKKMFMDRDESATAVVTGETTDVPSDADEKSPSASLELRRSPSNISPDEARDALAAVVEENLARTSAPTEIDSPVQTPLLGENDNQATQMNSGGVEHLDLALPHENNSELPLPSDITVSPELSGATTPLANESPSVFGETAESTLSERVDLLRRVDTASNDPMGMQNETSNLPRPSERGGLRRAGLATSPPINRTQSQPAGTLRRMKPTTSKSHGRQERVAIDTSDNFTMPIEPLKLSTTEPSKPTDKKLSERLGLSTLRGKKPGHSLIPRSVTSRRKDTKVSTLAKHFEQLSREFEKERVRDRRQRAAKVTQSRAFPKASSKPIVEIYNDVNEAVEERGPSEASSVPSSQPDGNVVTVVSGLARLNTEGGIQKSARPASLTSTAVTAEETAEETATEAETDDNPHNVSHTGSDDEGAASDADHSLLDQIMPGAAEIAESLGKPDSDLPLELPKHEKSSLMKMLTNFWAERSASGWTALEYPVNTSDHIFADMDVIIREDEPSSLIAFALQSPRYQDELSGLRAQETRSRILDAGVDINRHPRNEHDVFQDGIIEPGVETSLLREQGTHISLSFTDGSATLQCKIFYAEQFDALRRKCGVADRIVESLSRCLKWDSKGGKTKSVFLKTLDDRLILKSLSSIETQAFLNFAPAYFNMMAEILFHELPSVIAKMLGFYQIVLKNPITGIEVKLDVLVMENLFYDRTPDRIFDLKGSMRNRKIESTGEQNEVLLDENMVEFIYESPLFTREHAKNLLRKSVFNDTLFLQRNDVMDYSLMLAFDESRKELVVGIIDVVRTYTWDKKLESWIKDRGFAGGNRNKPTVTSPKEYKNRFREAMDRYILQAPSSWHQWQQTNARAEVEARLQLTPDKPDTPDSPDIELNLSSTEQV